MSDLELAKAVTNALAAHARILLAANEREAQLARALAQSESKCAELAKELGIEKDAHARCKDDLVATREARDALLEHVEKFTPRREQSV
jgi:predicted  nucleic acid-binding Zn-ribbon protein